MPQLVMMGNEGEHLIQQVQFDLPDELSAASILLHVQMDGFADVISLGAERIFTPTRSHTAHPGRHTAYLEALVGEERVWRSDVFYLNIQALPEDGETLQQLYPTAVEQAMVAAAKLTGLGVQAETLAEGQAATVRTAAAQDGTDRLIFGIPKGDKGDKGDTPVKGEDYFTLEEQQAMVGEVLAAIEAAEGEVY